MGYEELWKLLDCLLTELRSKGEVIPADIMNDLHSAKTMIQILRADPSHTENVPRVETYLGNVEFNLLCVAQERFGTEFAEQWIKRLEKARRAVHGEGATPRFVPGIPRGEHWVRVQVSKETPQKNVERLAEKSKLSYKIQGDGYVLVWGKNEKIKSFVGNLRKAQMASKSSRPKREKQF